MIKTSESHSQVLVIDILTAPRAVDSIAPGLPDTSAWIGHPLITQIAGFGAACLEIRGNTAHVTWYGLDVGDEPSALAYALDILRRNHGPVVSFGGGNYVPRMLAARMNDCGLPATSDLEMAASDGCDLADSVALGGCFPRLTLGQVAAVYELIAPEPAPQHVPQARHPTDSGGVLAGALRTRLDTIIALFARLNLGPDGGTVGSLVSGRVATSGMTLSQAA